MDSGSGYGSLAELPEVSGTGMEVLRNSQKFRVLWHGRTELTEVPGGSKKHCTPTPGIVARGGQNSQNFRVRVRMSYRTHRSHLYRLGRCTELIEVPGTGNTRENTRPRGRSRFEVEVFIQLAWHVLTGLTSPRQSVAVRTLSTTTERNL